MKKNILIILILLLILRGLLAQKTTGIIPYPTPVNPLEKAGWVLVFQDEFEGDTLNAHWWPQTGSHGTEPQWYTTRKENVFVKNGLLHLKAIKETVKDSFEFTSGMIFSSKTFGKGTYAEVRCKIPEGKGAWPAFWFWAATKYYQEIDAFEFWTHDTKRYSVTTHYWDKKKQRPIGQYKWIYPRTAEGKRIDMSKAFFTFAVYWDDSGIYYLLNNVLVEKQTTNVPPEPFPIILNLAVEGEKWKPMKSVQFPKEFLIDYVRIYKKERKKD